MDIFMIIVELLHIGVMVFIVAGLIKGFKSSFQTKSRSSSIHTAVAILLTVFTLICFALNREFSLIPTNEGYPEYAALVGIGFLAYWIKKIVPNHQYKLKIVLSVLSTTLLFSSVFACIHLFPYGLLILFPVFGLMVGAPFFVFVLSFSDLLVNQKREHTMHPGTILGISTWLIVALAFISNLWSDQSWSLIHYFIQPITKHHLL